MVQSLVRVVNFKLRKRIRSAKSYKSKASFQILNSKKVDKSWEECVNILEKRSDHHLKFSTDDFMKTKSYFEVMSKDGHEYCRLEDFMDFMNMQCKDKLYIQRTLVENLPIICLKVADSQTLLVDAEVFFSSPKMMCDLIKVENSAQEQENKSTKKKRKDQN